jgi:hypothetical protein
MQAVPASAAVASMVVIATLARRIEVPYPILLVLGGLVIGLLPGLPRVELDPELVLLVFLPPLLYAAAIATPVRELRANLQPISLLAFGLVLATIAVVAVTARSRPPPSPTGWACPAAWSPSWKARACSTTPPRWCCSGWRPRRRSAPRSDPWRSAVRCCWRPAAASWSARSAR